MISPRGGVAYGNEARPTLNPFLRYLRAFRSPRRGPHTPFGGRILIRVGIGFGGLRPGWPKLGTMPDLGAMLLRRSLGSLSPSSDGCGECRRIPLAGERPHELDSGRVLCELCFGAPPGEHFFSFGGHRPGRPAYPDPYIRDSRLARVNPLGPGAAPRFQLRRPQA